jgi:S-formylglutathione hydrolase
MRFGVYSCRRRRRTPVPGAVFPLGPDLHRAELHPEIRAQRYAAEHGVIVSPDTSPRGRRAGCRRRRHRPERRLLRRRDAGAVVAHYRMHTYVAHELPALIEQHFPVTGARSITGHSMGGHGALICALRNPGRYRSVSALAPICSASRGWGRKAFPAYFGDDPAAWREWDACDLLRASKEKLSLLVDQGTPIPSSKTACNPICYAKLAPRTATHSTCACARVTTTASTSSRPSSASTSRITRAP